MLHAASLATVTIDLHAARHHRRRVCAERLRRDCARRWPAGCRWHISGRGPAARPGWIAAAARELDGVMAWNPGSAARERRDRVSVAARHRAPRPRSTAPAVDGQGRGLAARRRRRRIRERSARHSMPGASLARWYWDHILSPDPGAHAGRRMGQPCAPARGQARRGSRAARPRSRCRGRSEPASAATPLPDFGQGSITERKPDPRRQLGRRRRAEPRTRPASGSASSD